jgi:THO complex subunit 2
VRCMEKDEELSVLLQVLMVSAARDIIPRSDVLSALAESGISKSERATSILTDALWIIGGQAEFLRDKENCPSSKESENLANIVRDIAEMELVSAMKLKTILEIDELHKAGLSAEFSVANKKIVRINTRNLYTQNKFNLLREESEGFSKVLCLLHSEITEDSLEVVKRDLLALIGKLDIIMKR